MKLRAVFGILCAVSAPMGLASCGAGAEGASTPAHGNVRALRRVRVDARLRAMGPDGWHRLALHGNWDFVEPEVWRWIVTQPDCDRATALAIFWKAQPDYYVAFADRASVPEVNREGFDLVTLIRGRWLSGAYSRSELAFERDSDSGPVDMAALELRHGDTVEQFIPASMRVSLPGRRIPDEGPPLPGVVGR